MLRVLLDELQNGLLWRFREVIDTAKPIKDVAHAYGVGAKTLRNWLIKYRETNGSTEEKLSLRHKIFFGFAVLTQKC